MRDARITTIVVNWNLKETTGQCLRSLEMLDTPSNIIVVDNGSEDGSADDLARRFPQAAILALPENIGFGAACNRAITEALKNDRCEYIFLLNNDARVHPQALDYLVRAAEFYPRAGAFAAKIYYEDAPNMIWYAGARMRSLVLAATETGRGQLDRGQFDQPKEVDFIFGTAILIRRTVIETIGCFDERFFLYMEDLDYCLRAKQAGFQLMFVPQAKIWHRCSASTAQNIPLRRYHLVKSTVAYLKKHTTPFTLVPVLVFWLLVSMRELKNDLLQGNLDVIRAHFTGLQNGFSSVDGAKPDLASAPPSHNRLETLKKNTHETPV